MTTIKATCPACGEVDLSADDVLLRYTITATDVAGPFVEHIPQDMMEKANLPALGYTSLLEALAGGLDLVRGMHTPLATVQVHADQRRLPALGR